MNYRYPPTAFGGASIQESSKFERGTVKRRDLLVGFVSGVGFTAGNAYLWQMAENSSQARETLAEDGYDLDGDPFAIPDGEEGIGAPVSPPASRVRATVADAVDLPSLDALTEERSIQSSSLVEAHDLLGGRVHHLVAAAGGHPLAPDEEPGVLVGRGRHDAGL